MPSEDDLRRANEAMANLGRAVASDLRRLGAAIQARLREIESALREELRRRASER
jgi:hypothetical protein